MAKNSYFIGIDPGLSGAVALVDDTGRAVMAASLPTCGERASHRIDAAALARILWPFALSIQMGVIEAVSAMPRQGIASTFRFARAVGAVEGVLAALDIPVIHVPPAQWKRMMGLSADKEQVRAKAIARWPAIDLARRADHDRAEALWLALYARGLGNERFVQPNRVN